MLTRGITRDDFLEIVSVIDLWWGGPTSALAHPLFFYELGERALIVEDEGRMVGFLLGFLAGESPKVGYIHLVGIDPAYRRKGVGKALYAEFILQAKRHGASRIKAITTPNNVGSIAFHDALGFKGEALEDYAGPNRTRVVFTLTV
jgi:ribosomal protein S18 acetylase RimI-like enzyme